MSIVSWCKNNLIGVASVGALFFTILILPHSGFADDLRAERETMTIEFSGVRDSSTAEFESSLKQELSGRFEIINKGGLWQLSLYGSKKGTPPAKGPDKRDMQYLVTIRHQDGAIEVLFKDLNEGSGFGSLSSMVARKLAKAAPLVSRVVSTQGDEVIVDMGSNVGLKRGDRLSVLNYNDKRSAVVKIDQVSEFESRGHKIAGDDIHPGQKVSPQLRLRGGWGIEYTHISVPAGNRHLTGRIADLQFRYDPPSMAPLGFIVASGYADLPPEKGWHVLNIEAVFTLELRPDFLYLEFGGGGGFSLTEWKYVGEDTTKGPAAKGVGMYDGFAGVRFLFARTIAVSVRAGYLGYTRYEEADQPVLRFGITWFGV